MGLSLDRGKKAGMMIAIIITIIMSASAAPLEISIEEKVNTTVNMTDYNTQTFEYKTNVTGYVNITNNGNDVLYDIWIALELVNNTTACGALGIVSKPDYATVTRGASPPERVDKVLNDSNCYVHITILRPGDSVVLFYDVNDNAMGIANGAPFDIAESYSPNKIPARGEYTWQVYFNVSLNETWWQSTAFSLSGKNILLNITKYLSNQTANFGSADWTWLNLSDNQTNKGSSSIIDSPYFVLSTTDGMKVTNVLLNTSASSNKYVNITFKVTGNYSNSTAAPQYFEPFGFAVFEFNADGNVSGSYVVDVFAVGNASLNVTKDGPDANNVWRGNVTITNTASGLTYVLTNVTMWATETGSFTNTISGSYQEWKPNVQLGYGESWNTSSGSPPGINFTYSQVPIIWANATFKLINDQTTGWYFKGNRTLNDTNTSYGSNFIVIEKIYIIGTYLVKVTKHVKFNESASDSSSNVFDVYLVVENIGGNESPYVYVYDLIPENFNEYNWNGNWNDIGQDGNWVNKSSMLAGNGSVSSPMSGYSKGYYWRLKPLSLGANGNGDYEDWTEIENNKTVVIFYQLNGTGDFKVLDAFVVGIDPMYSLNEQTSPKITLVSGAKATNYETTLATITFASMGALVAVYVRRNGRKG